MGNEQPILDKLQTRIVKNEQLGQAWVAAHAQWMQLDESKKNFLAGLMNDIDRNTKTEKLSEIKIERLARGSKTYEDFITGMCVAKAEELHAKVRYDNACEMFRAMQSAQAYEREKLRLNI